MLKFSKYLVGIVSLAGNLAVAAPIPVVDVTNTPASPGAYVGLVADLYQQTFAAESSGLLSGLALFGRTGTGGVGYRTTIKLKIGGEGLVLGGWDAIFAGDIDGGILDLTSFNLHAEAGENITFEVGYSGNGLWMNQNSFGTLYSHRRSDPADIYALRPNRSLAFQSYISANEDTPPSIPVSAPSSASLILAGLGMLSVAGILKQRVI